MNFLSKPSFLVMNINIEFSDEIMNSKLKIKKLECTVKGVEGTHCFYYYSPQPPHKETASTDHFT